MVAAAIARLDAAATGWVACEGDVPFGVLLDRAMGALTERPRAGPGYRYQNLPNTSPITESTVGAASDRSSPGTDVATGNLPAARAL